MKKMMFIICVILFPNLLLAQSEAEIIYRKYSDMENVNSFGFSGSFLKDVDFDIDNDDGKNKNVVGDIDDFKFLYTSDSKICGNILSDIDSELTKGKYKEIDLEGDDENDLRCFVKGKRKNFTECHILVEGDESVSFISFYGDFEVDEIKDLAKIGKSQSKK